MILDLHICDSNNLSWDYSKHFFSFQVDIIASLSPFVAPENVDLLLLAMNILLKKLRRLLKKKDNCLNETSLIKALHKILKVTSCFILLRVSYLVCRIKFCLLLILRYPTLTISSLTGTNLS